jgi:hypothetical protein
VLKRTKPAGLRKHARERICLIKRLEHKILGFYLLDYIIAMLQKIRDEEVPCVSSFFEKIEKLSKVFRYPSGQEVSGCG